MDGVGQRGRGGKRAARENTGQHPGVRFVGVFRQQDGEGIGADSFQQRGRGLTAPRIHPHVERAFELDRETAGRIVELHGGYAKIGDDHVDSGELLDGENFRQPGKIAAVRHEYLQTQPAGTQPRLGLGQLDGINVQPDEASAGLQLCQQFTGVAAVAQGAIHGHFARLRMQHLENLRDHDGPVRAGRRLAGGEHFRDRFGVTLRMPFLVFFFEAARIFSRIARSPLVRGSGNSFRCRSVAHD